MISVSEQLIKFVPARRPSRPMQPFSHIMRISGTLLSGNAAPDAILGKRWPSPHIIGEVGPLVVAENVHLEPNILRHMPW